MQISRTLLIAWVAASATTLLARGPDTPAQMKAREAMRQKIQDSQGQPAPTASPSMAAPAAPTAPAVESDKLVPPPAPVTTRADSEAIAKAREAVRQRIEENPAAPPTAAAPAPAPVPEPAVTHPVVAAPPAAPAPPEPAPMPAPADSDAIAKARQAVRNTINGEPESGPKADADSIARAREALRQRVQSMNYAGPTSLAGNAPESNFPPLEGPPLPISTQKQQRLNELLQRYRADQVTPEQYQTERAKILAGP